MALLDLFIAAAGIYSLVSLWRLVHNYRAIQNTGFRAVICPIDPDNPLWMIISPRSVPFMEKYLLSSVYLFIRRSIYGWEFREKEAERPFTPPGFVFVNPGKNEFWIEDAEIAHAVLMRWKDFPQGELIKFLLDFFGTNILTSNGDDWQRQRRLIGPVINERISKIVWQETASQAQEMADYYITSGDTSGSLDGLRLIAFNVLSTVGYGLSRPWKETAQPPEAGHRLSYSDAIRDLVFNLVVAAAIPTRLLLQPFMPQKVQNIGYAVQEFPKYTQEMLRKERERFHATETGENFLRALVRVSDQERELDPKGGLKKCLSESEIQGNVFLLTLAGFDTTANTLAYAMTWLAIDPAIQRWLNEEVEQVSAESEDDSYEKVFPKLVRCLAFMLEILRHYPSVGHIVRCTTSPQTVTTDQRTYYFPANMKVYLSAQAIHMDPATWGDDAAEFRPSRWLQASTSPSNPPSLKKMPRGTFIPWSIGPRTCPGMKMAQVEFTRVIYEILQRCRIEPVFESGETLGMMRERLREEIKDSQPRISLQMNHPERVKLRWIKKERA